MIIGFEKETSELNDHERNNMLPLVVKVLSTAIGKHKAVTSGNIMYYIRLNKFKCDSARIRKVIHEIRVKGLLKNLIATSNGYYIAETKQEIDTYIQSLRQREDSIREIRKSLITQSTLL